MNKSPNLFPPHTEWQRYESPAVLRKHGREYLERFWSPMTGERSLEAAINRLARNFGAGIYASDDTVLLFFENPETAASCAKQLRRFSEIGAIQAQLTVNRKVTP
jgi:hypothetical protein